MANNKFSKRVAESPFKDERAFLVDLLGKYPSVAKAAEAINVSHETLYKKCREHGVSFSRKLVVNSWN